jgi:hypothetical protein
MCGPALYQGAAGRGDIFALACAGLRKDRVDLQAAAVQHRLLPGDIICAGRRFNHFQIGRADFMRRRRGNRHQP